MNNLKAIALLSGALILGACSQPTAKAPTSPDTAPNVSAGRTAADLGITQVSPTGRWFIELEGEPDALSAQSLTSQQARVRLAAQSAGIQYQEVASYQTLFNGFSVEIADAEVSAFRRLDGVKAVYPVGIVQQPQVAEGSRPEMKTAVELTGADYAQNELGLTGKGIKVGIIDSGMDNEHAAFSGRIAYQYDFVGDDFDASAKNGKPIPFPDDNADDCGGHGSHVAGIVGGKDTATGFKGVAPDVIFGSYKVFGCDGSTTSDVMLAAMERAANDGMDVVNMSIGYSYQWGEYPTAKAADRLVKRGVFVTVSAGNSQRDGQFATGAPSVAEKVVSVAAVNNTAFALNSIVANIGGEERTIGFYNGSTAPEPAAGDTFTINTIADPINACNGENGNPFAEGQFKGQVVLIQRGGCYFSDKAKNVSEAGASAIVMFNNSAGYMNPSLGDVKPGIPYISISLKDGEDIKAALEAGKEVTLRVTGEKEQFEFIEGGGITDFSSYGSGPDLELKPELSAPGGNIYSAWSDGGYETISGTSMAAPHVAGAAALLLEANPDITPDEMKTLMMNTAGIRDFFFNGQFLTGLPIYTQLQGAGLLDIPAAYYSKMTAVPAKLSLGESDEMATRSKVVTLHNHGDSDQVLNVYHLPALTIAGGTFNPSPDTSFATAEINGESADLTKEGGGVAVTVPAGGTAELNIRITAPMGADVPDLSQYGGFIVAEAMGEDADGQPTAHPVVSVPYGGFIGDYQALKVLGDVQFSNADKPYNFPALYLPVTDEVFFEGETPEKMPSFTFIDLNTSASTTVLDAPVIWANFNHQAQEVVLEALALDDKGEVAQVHEFDRIPFIGRSPSNKFDVGNGDRPWSDFLWDGTYEDGAEAPAGLYQLRLRVLKALGNPDNVNHWETYTTPTFRVIRAPEAK